MGSEWKLEVGLEWRLECRFGRMFECGLECRGYSVDNCVVGKVWLLTWGAGEG